MFAFLVFFMQAAFLFSQNSTRKRPRKLDHERICRFSRIKICDDLSHRSHPNEISGREMTIIEWIQNVLCSPCYKNKPLSDKEIYECIRTNDPDLCYVEVKNILDKSAMGLSGGQQQRLCIARTIAVEPEVILMDEPCSALDPISTQMVEETIAKLKKYVTIVIVTHSMSQARRVSDRTAFMLRESSDKPASLIEVGDTKTMFENPTDPRTASYIGGSFG